MNLLTDFFLSLHSYREYLKQSVARDLRKRYKRSSLGYLWSMLEPLLMMIVLTIVFSKIMGTRTEDFAVFVFCGMIPWRYFNTTVQGNLGVISSNARLIGQVPVPKYIFPVSLAVSNLANFSLSLIPLILVMFFAGRDPQWTVLLLPLIMLPLFFVAVGAALIFAASNVFFDDTQHLVGVGMQALYFLCPILYARDNLPEWLINIVVLNPMFTLIESFRKLFYEGALPDLSTYLYSFGGALLFLYLGLWIFRKADNKFIYFI